MQARTVTRVTADKRCDCQATGEPSQRRAPFLPAPTLTSQGHSSACCPPNMASSRACGSLAKPGSTASGVMPYKREVGSQAAAQRGWLWFRAPPPWGGTGGGRRRDQRGEGSGGGAVAQGTLFVLPLSSHHPPSYTSFQGPHPACSTTLAQVTQGQLQSHPAGARAAGQDEGGSQNRPRVSYGTRHKCIIPHSLRHGPLSPFHPPLTCRKSRHQATAASSMTAGGLDGNNTRPHLQER